VAHTEVSFELANGATCRTEVVVHVARPSLLGDHPAESVGKVSQPAPQRQGLARCVHSRAWPGWELCVVGTCSRRC
jgi:hypothetical protein